MDQQQNVETVQTVEGLEELTEKVDTLVEVLEEQAAGPTPEEIEAEKKTLAEEQKLKEEQQLLFQQQAQDELLFREQLLIDLKDLNENTMALIEKTDSSNSMFEEVAPYAKQASEWVIVAIVIMFLLWIVKQLEDMFNSAFR